MSELPVEINALQVKDLLVSGARPRIVDVREPFEYDLCRIEGSELIPMQTVPANLGRLDTGERLIVVICHHGVRSLSVVNWLREQGVDNCQSLAGGIDRWSREVDPSVPRY